MHQPPQDLSNECGVCRMKILPHLLALHERHCGENQPSRLDDGEAVIPRANTLTEFSTLRAIADHQREATNRAYLISAGTVPANLSRVHVVPSGPDAPVPHQAVDYPPHFEPVQGVDEANDGLPTPPSPAPAAPRDPIPDGLQPDDIKVEFHPASRITTKVFRFDDYCRSPTSPDPAVSAAANSGPTEPWYPFPTRLDFELAEVMLDSHMNERQIEALLEIVHQAHRAHRPAAINANDDSVTIRDFKELTDIWSFARQFYAEQFQKSEVRVEYNGESLGFDVFFRPLWDWCLEILSDVTLVSQFEWDAQRLSKYDEKKKRFVRFLDEPWTANGWWEFQSTIPAAGKPFCIIFYADKTRLSSFGTEKGYPVLVRCANLPVAIRNGAGVGGGRLIGWLPIPKEDVEESRKYDYVNMKREIWHRAVGEILNSIIPYAETGYQLTCGDGVQRFIFPHILMLSADFEEQSMMALTRGGTAKTPCPICLVSRSRLSILSERNTLRTTLAMREILNEALRLPSRTARDNYLRPYGLREVHNIFWDIKGVDVYSALSWDRLHAYHLGLFGDHLLGEVKKILLSFPSKGRRESGMIDNGLDAVPPWRELTHFQSLHSTGEYADGTKFEDLSKVIIFASIEVFTPERTCRGYHLLKLLRSYLELDMFASLTVHTEDTLAEMTREFQTFDRLVQEYKLMSKDDKSWDFPKMHTHEHVFLDIMRKGVTRNFNTKPNEKANGPFKKYYRNHTNFKNVAPQILKVNEMDVVALIIRAAIDRLDEEEEHTLAKARDASEDRSTEHLDTGGTASTDVTSANSESESKSFERISFGAWRPEILATAVSAMHPDDPAFLDFPGKLTTLLAKLLKQRRVQLPEGQVVTPYLFMKVQYADVIDWNWKADILRVNPMFHNKSRYDFALIQIKGNECVFVQLLFTFAITFNQQAFHLALVLPMDATRSRVNLERDKELRLTRVRPRPRASTKVISTDTIIRGGLLTRDPRSGCGELFAIDFIDEDMWRRMKGVILVQNARL